MLINKHQPAQKQSNYELDIVLNKCNRDSVSIQKGQYETSTDEDGQSKSKE